MAWIALDLDDTLVNKDPETQESMPVEGAPEAMGQLAAEGHRLTVFTSRFAAMPDEIKQRVKEEIEQELMTLGFPPMEVWTGTHKPACDFFVGNKDVTFDSDWGLALAQMQVMMEERGLVPPPAADGMPMQDEAPEEGEDLGEQNPENFEESES